MLKLLGSDYAVSRRIRRHPRRSLVLALKSGVYRPSGSDRLMAQNHVAGNVASGRLWAALAVRGLKTNALSSERNGNVAS